MSSTKIRFFFYGKKQKELSLFTCQAPHFFSCLSPIMSSWAHFSSYETKKKPLRQARQALVPGRERCCKMAGTETPAILQVITQLSHAIFNLLATNWAELELKGFILLLKQLDC